MSNGIRKVAYELYKENWISTHTTREQRLDDIRNWAETEIENDDEEMACSYEECREEFGYGGELYVCFEEFLDYEYQDRNYMNKLLSSDVLMKAYKRDLKEMEEENER